MSLLKYKRKGTPKEVQEAIKLQQFLQNELSGEFDPQLNLFDSDPFEKEIGNAFEDEDIQHALDQNPGSRFVRWNGNKVVIELSNGAEVTVIPQSDLENRNEPVR